MNCDKSGLKICCFWENKAYVRVLLATWSTAQVQAMSECGVMSDNVIIMSRYGDGVTVVTSSIPWYCDTQWSMRYSGANINNCFFHYCPSHLSVYYFKETSHMILIHPSYSGLRIYCREVVCSKLWVLTQTLACIWLRHSQTDLRQSQHNYNWVSRNVCQNIDTRTKCCYTIISC